MNAKVSRLAVLPPGGAPVRHARTRGAEPSPLPRAQRQLGEQSLLRCRATTASRAASSDSSAQSSKPSSRASSLFRAWRATGSILSGDRASDPPFERGGSCSRPPALGTVAF